MVRLLGAILRINLPLLKLYRRKKKLLLVFAVMPSTLPKIWLPSKRSAVSREKSLGLVLWHSR